MFVSFSFVGLFLEFSHEGGVVFVDYGNNSEKTPVISADDLVSTITFDASSFQTIISMWNSCQ